MHTVRRLRHLPLSQARRVVEPVVEPLALHTVKAHLRVLHDSEDAYIQGLIITAREAAEQETRRALCLQTWRMTLDRMPTVELEEWWDGVRDGALPTEPTSAMELPRPPLQSVTGITTYDEADTATVWDPLQYRVDTNSDPGQVVLRPGQMWPQMRYQARGMEIEFVAGYSNPASVPHAITHGMLMLIAELYRYREPSESGSLSSVPYGIAQLWGTYVVRL